MTQPHKMIALLFLLLASCGQDEKTAPSDPSTESLLEGTYSWVIGDWKLTNPDWLRQEEKFRVSLTPKEFFYEKRGIFLELIVEESAMSDPGNPVANDCVYRMVAKDFWLRSAAPDDVTIQYRKGRFELVEDPRNEPRCADEIRRMNRVLRRTSVVSTYDYGVLRRGADGTVGRDQGIFAPAN